MFKVIKSLLNFKDNAHPAFTCNQAELSAKNTRHIYITGESHKNSTGLTRQQILDRVKPYDTIYLRHESGNKYDKKAIAVVTNYGQIGYIPRGTEDQDEVLKLLKNDVPYTAYVWSKKKAHNKLWGATILIITP